MPSSVEWRLLEANLRLRAAFLRDVPVLHAAELGGPEDLPRAEAEEIVRAWQRERRVVAIEVGGTELFPAFQFGRDGQPRPIVRDILAALPEAMTPWQVAFWFTTANGWLDGAFPCERLDDGDAVLAAARQLSNGAIG